LVLLAACRRTLLRRRVEHRPFLDELAAGLLHDQTAAERQLRAKQLSLF
jgi:hypothetical protein